MRGFDPESNDATRQDIHVDFQAEGVRNLVGNAWATESRIEALDLENRGDQFFARPFGSGATPSLRGKQPLILSADERSMKSPQR